MLVRGANAVGYKSYPDNVIREFIRLAAANGIDVFRIFDCFNDVEQMRVCVDAAREAGKLAEVCVCFTGNFLDPAEKTYTLDYYRAVAKQVADCGAHIIGIKDMAGLFRPQMAKPFLEALRSVTDLPVHFHTHNTSSAALSAAIDMARSGCAVIDLAIASMSDTTSQPSLNAFLASMGLPPLPSPLSLYSFVLTSMLLHC
jgi:pyruvate carboxylase